MFANYYILSPGDTGPVPALLLQTIVLVHLPVRVKPFTDKNAIQTNRFFFLLMEIQSLMCAIVLAMYAEIKNYM